MDLVCVHVQFWFGVGIPAGAWLLKTDRGRTCLRWQSGVGTRAYFAKGVLETEPGSEWLKVTAVRGDQEREVRKIHTRDSGVPIVRRVDDFVGWTQIDVLVELETAPSAEDRQVWLELQAFAFELVRRFLRWYRVSTMAVDAPVPRLPDSPLVLCSAAKEYSWEGRDIQARLRRVTRQIHWESPDVVGIRWSEIPSGDLTRWGRQVRTRIEKGDDPEMHIELILDAREMSRANGNHRMSVVLSQNAVEVFLQATVARGCKARGILELEDRHDKKRDVDEALRTANLKDDIIKTYIPFLFGRSLSSTRAYQEWHKDTFEPRNEIVHRGRVEVTKDEARRAFESGVAFINLVASVVR